VRAKFFLRIISLFFFFCSLFITQVSAQEQSIDEFILQVQKDLESHDIPAYLEAFVPALREAEKVALEDKVNISEIDKITFHRASKDVQKKDRVTAYFQVLYENDYSAMIETWRLFLSQMDKEWQIEKKDVVGELKSLYKIKIPSDRVERVRSFKVRHVDIELSFEEASLFYDNIPGLETALIVIGKGFLTFSPSIPREQHQLQLIYKSKVLQESLEYAYLRFSDDFFHNNIKITKASIQDSRPVSKPEIDKARSIFDRHYARSLAIENSLNKELLSFVPQDEQAIFEFKGEDIDPLTYIYSPFAEDKVTLINIKKEKLISLYSPQEEGKKKLFISFGQKYDIKSYKIDIDFNPKMSYLSGKASIEISSKVGRLDSIKFKLNSQLQILRIFDEEKNTKVDFKLFDGKLNRELDIVNSHGGSVVLIVNVILRVMFAEILGVKGPLIFDEPGTFIDVDKMQNFGKFLKAISKQLNRQIIVVSHIPDIIERADKRFTVYKDGAVSKVMEE